MMDDPCRHGYVEKISYSYTDPDATTQMGQCTECRRRITRFWIDGNDDRPGYWSRWKLENILLVEDDFHG